MPMYLLVPPAVEDGPAAWRKPLDRYRITRGISILKRWDGSYYTTRYPGQVELEEVQLYYLGGHEYTVDQAEADALTAAGFGAYLTPIAGTAGYGRGPYGRGPYGGTH